jgi:hypothetical protein
MTTTSTKRKVYTFLVLIAITFCTSAYAEFMTDSNEFAFFIALFGVCFSAFYVLAIMKGLKAGDPIIAIDDYNERKHYKGTYIGKTGEFKSTIILENGEMCTCYTDNICYDETADKTWNKKA